jgi:hypothetical protein
MEVELIIVYDFSIVINVAYQHSNNKYVIKPKTKMYSYSLISIPRSIHITGTPANNNGCHFGNHCPWKVINFVKNTEVNRNINPNLFQRLLPYFFD